LVGCAVFEPLLERFGYKKVIYIVCLVQTVAIVSKLALSCLEKTNAHLSVELTSKEWIQFSVGRVLAYLAVGIVENAVPSYEAELAPAALRGFLAGNVQVFVHIGAIWGACMSFAFRNELGRIGWIVPVVVQLIPPLLLVMTVPFCIESPRWLVSKGRKVSQSCRWLRHWMLRVQEEALRNLERIRPARDVDQGIVRAEVDLYEQALLESRQIEEAGWLDLFSRRYLSRTLVSC
jgi:MFS family permease